MDRLHVAGWNLCWQMQAGARPALPQGTQPLSTAGKASADLARQHLLRPTVDVVCLQEIWKPSWSEWMDRALEGAPVLIPSSYDGPILVSDIDDTLRRTSEVAFDEDISRLGDPALAVDGCHALLHACASLGVPIFYLTLGSDTIRAHNHRFLGALPRGVLVDFPSRMDASQRMFFKVRVLEQLRRDFPRAWLVCLGDNVGPDPYVYRTVRQHPQDSIYIRTVNTSATTRHEDVEYFSDYTAIHAPLLARLTPTGFPPGALLYNKKRHHSSSIVGCVDEPRWGLVNGEYANACISTLYNTSLYRLVDSRVLPVQAGDEWHLVQLVRLAVNGDDDHDGILLDVLNVHAPHTTDTTMLEAALERVYGLAPRCCPSPHVVLLGNANVQPQVPVLQLVNRCPGGSGFLRQPPDPSCTGSPAPTMGDRSIQCKSGMFSSRRVLRSGVVAPSSAVWDRTPP